MTPDESKMWLAVAAFEDVERVELLLAKKKKGHRQALAAMPPEQCAEYYRQTERIRNQYDEKTVKAKV